MANTITGKILYIYPTQQLPSKDGSKQFFKRSIVLDCTRYDQYTGEKGIENTPMLEFTNDKCTELDNYQIGQVVTISFDVQGTRYKNKEGVEQIFTRVRPYKIEAKQLHSAPPQQAPVQQAAPQPNSTFTPPAEEKSDLPF